MQTTKKPKKTTKPVTPAGERAAAVVGKKKKKKFTRDRLRELLDLMLGQFSEQLDGEPLKYSAGDGLKMMQMRQAAEPEQATEVTVGWIEDPRT